MPAIFFALTSLAASPAATATPYTPDANAAAADIPAIYHWDLSPLFADDAAWEVEYERVMAALPTMDAFRGTLSDPAQLRACLDQYFSLQSAANRLSLYAGLRQTTAQSDTAANAMNQRGMAVVGDLSKQTVFMRGEIMALTDKQLTRGFKKQPELETYRIWIDELRRRRDHVLSPDAERVLALMGDNLFASIDLNEIESRPEKSFKAMLSDMELPVITDDKGQQQQLTLALYGRLRESPDRRVRRAAVEGLFSSLRRYQHVYASTLAGQVQIDVDLARARGYDTARHAYLDKEDIDTAVYDNLVQTVDKHVESLHRYVTLRKRVLGLDEVHLYDMYIPLVPGVDREIPFDEARGIVEAALAPLGPDYIKVLHHGMDPASGWMDVYPAADKDSGAFSAGTYGVHPYVMLNQFDSLYGMFTLAHEFGHAMHSYLSMKNQPEPIWGYATFLAETASTANEALLLDYLLEHAQSDDERIFLLNERLSSIKGTIFRQTQFAEFEWRIHQLAEAGTPLTPDLLDQTYRDLVQKYYGPDYVLGPDDGLEWAYIGHFYYKYYLYSYATGLSSGIAIAERLRNGGPAEQQAYLGMLRAGASRPPLDILRGAGVDMREPRAVEAAMQLFDDTLAELEVLLEAREARQKAEAAEGAEPTGD